jgi:hypothetical protein
MTNDYLVSNLSRDLEASGRLLLRAGTVTTGRASLLPPSPESFRTPSLHVPLCHTRTFSQCSSMRRPHRTSLVPARLTTRTTFRSGPKRRSTFRRMRQAASSFSVRGIRCPPSSDGIGTRPRQAPWLPARPRVPPSSTDGIWARSTRAVCGRRGSDSPRLPGRFSGCRAEGTSPTTDNRSTPSDPGPGPSFRRPF